MNFPVFSAVGATFAYLARRALDLLKALWLPAMLLLASLAAVLPDYFGAAIALSALSPDADPQQAMAHLGPLMRSGGLLLLIAAVFYPMLAAASLRHIVRGDEMKRPFYLGYGGDELRILGAYALILVLLIVAYVVYAIAVGVIAAVLALISPTVAGLGGFAVGLAGLCALLWFMARLSVAFPAALSTRTIGLAQSWRATKGRALPLIGFWFFIGVALLLIAGVYAAAVMQPVLAVYGDLLRAGDDQAANIKLLQAQRSLYDMGSTSFWPFMVGTWIYTMAIMALMNVAAGTAWRYLTDAPSGAKD